MTDDRDAKLAALLRGNAPDARDPLFRLSVLERRERLRFRRRTALATAAAAAAILIAVAAEAAGARAMEATGVVFFGVVLTIAGVVFAPTLLRTLLRLRA